MRHAIWEWIVRADDRTGDVALDASLAIAVAAVATREYGSPHPMVVVDFSAPTQGAMQAYAQMGGATASVKPNVKPTRPKVAKRWINRERDLAHLPEDWSRDRYRGMAVARPLGW